jgi:hypothetical protein
MKTRFVANGFQRWTRARDVKAREIICAKSVTENQAPGLFKKNPGMLQNGIGMSAPTR